MTPQEAAEAITGVKDDGSVCTPNSKMGRSRQIAQAIEEAVAAERERCAQLVPTNWCDPLLTGKDVPKGSFKGPDIERLLAGVQERIRGA